MTKKKVLFLVNTLTEFDFGHLITKYLNGIEVLVGEFMPEHSEEYDLIILWRYKKILSQINGKKNIIIFHSSNLPDGKGWAPIYYSVANNLPYYTISGILPAEPVDSGDIVVKARFRINDDYTAEYIRRWDYEISIMLVKEILERFDGREFKGVKQNGQGNYWKRRYPEDNEVNIDMPLKSILAHLRACENQHPAFFWYNKIKYNIYIKPDVTPIFPDDLEVVFLDE